MTHNNKVDVSHITKFDGQYFHVWKDKSTLMFKQKKGLANCRKNKSETTNSYNNLDYYKNLCFTNHMGW
jgi:hypothetical protein